MYRTLVVVIALGLFSFLGVFQWTHATDVAVAPHNTTITVKEPPQHICVTDNMKPVLIFAPLRSGSTLLLHLVTEILNSATVAVSLYEPRMWTYDGLVNLTNNRVACALTKNSERMTLANGRTHLDIRAVTESDVCFFVVKVVNTTLFQQFHRSATSNRLSNTVRVIVNVRHPYKTIESSEIFKKFYNQSVRDSITFIQAALTVPWKHPNVFMHIYEQTLTYPADSLRRLACFLGVKLSDTQLDSLIEKFNLNFSSTAATRRLKPYDVTGDGLTLKEALTYDIAIRDRWGSDLEDLYYAVVAKQV